MDGGSKRQVAFFIDGSFLPIRNGTSYSIYHLMANLYRSGRIIPNLLINYRGWDDPKLYFNQPFRTIFLPVSHYYNDTGILNHVFNTYNIKYVHIYNAEEVINLSARLKSCCTRIIYEAINIDHVLYGRLGRNTKDTKRLKEKQALAMRLSDFVLCRSSIDRNHIMNMGINRAKISIYRGAINVYGIKYLDREEKRYRVVFLGHMYYPPNEEVLELIVSKILPALRRLNPNYSLTIVGLTPPKIAREYSRQGIIFKGGVDDLSRELLNYDVAVSPLLSGSGTRLKILDYLASGLPVIATTLSIEGLVDKIKKYLVIEDNVGRYAQHIDRLMNNLSANRKMMRGGRAFVEKYYDWSNNLKPFLKIYQQ